MRKLTVERSDLVEQIAALAEKLDVSWWDHDAGQWRSFAALITERFGAGPGASPMEAHLGRIA